MFSLRFHSALICLSLGCLQAPKITPAQTEATEQAQMEAHDVSLVQDSARLYWDAVRWGDGSKAASFLEEPGMRLVYEAWLEDQKDSTRYEEVVVLQVQIEPDEDESASAVLQTATAYIRIKSYTLPEQILESKTIQQEWYKSASGWWITWEPPTD